MSDPIIELNSNLSSFRSQIRDLRLKETETIVQILFIATEYLNNDVGKYMIANDYQETIDVLTAFICEHANGVCLKNCFEDRFNTLKEARK